MLSGEFRAITGSGRLLGMDGEKLRAASRLLLRTPQIAAEGFAAISDNPSVRSAGGAPVGQVDIAFLVFAGLEAGPINEQLGARCWTLYTAPPAHFSTVTVAGRKRQARLPCPVTGQHRAGDALRNVLASPDDLAKRVREVSLWRERGETTILWDDHSASVFSHPLEGDDTKGQIERMLMTTATLRGGVLRELAEMTRGQHPISRRH
jgi:hypothetical protein